MSKKVVMRYPVRPDGTLEKGIVFFWVLPADGRHFGMIQGPEQPHNLAWGDDGGRTLYMTALTSVYRDALKD
jgi:hypothetical protein